MTLQVDSPTVYTSQGVPISVTGIAQVKIQGQNEEMLSAACEQFLGKRESEIQHIALVTLEGHQRAIMGSMTVEEIYKDRKKFSKQVFEVASSDLVNMGITVVSYTLKDIRDEEVSFRLYTYCNNKMCFDKKFLMLKILLKNIFSPIFFIMNGERIFYLKINCINSNPNKISLYFLFYSFD